MDHGNLTSNKHHLPKSIPPLSAVSKAIPSAFHGGGEGPILLDNLRCNGDEESLKDCTHDGVGEYSCSRSEIASVVCLNGEHCVDVL